MILYVVTVFFASFIINTDGKIENFRIESGVSPIINKEIERLLSTLTYKPGIKDKVAVPVSYHLKVDFYDLARPKYFEATKCGTWLPEFSYKPWTPNENNLSTPKAVWTYISKNVKYPKLNKKNRKKGRVIALFAVNANGKIEDIKITQSLGEGYDKEVIRLIEEMPDWTPGYINGVPKSCYYTLPVFFKK